MTEKTFILIKPDHVDLAGKIFSELDKYGHRAITAKVNSVPQEVIENHYLPHINKSFFEYMTFSFVGKSVVIAIYENESIIQKLINVIGPTDPAQASEDTIRGKYGSDSLKKAISEQRPLENVIHRSDSPEEAVREIEVWKNFFDY